MVVQMHRKAVVVIAILLLALSAIPFVSAVVDDNRNVVEGIVKNSSGQPVAGAYVKLKNAERRLTFMVISLEQGRYVADRLPPGKYSVQGIANGFESEWSIPVSVTSGKSAKQDVSLTKKQGPMLAPAWTHRMPEADPLPPLPEGKGKELVQTRCAGCHELADGAKSRMDRKNWQAIVDSMRQNAINNKLKVWTDEENATMVDYLATNFPPLPPPDPNSRFPRSVQPVGAPRKYRVVQYEIENPDVQQHDIAADPWGGGWANQRATGKISHFDANTLQYDEIVPPMPSGKRARIGEPRMSKEGVLWFADGAEKKAMAYDIKNKKWNSYTGGSGQGTPSFGANGLVWWQVGRGGLHSLSPATGEWKTYQSPVKQGAYVVQVAGDGTVWLDLYSVDKMVMFDPETAKFQEYKIEANVPHAYPRKMGTDWEGNVWVGLWRAGKLLKIDARTHQFSLFEPPTPTSGTYSPDYDPKNKFIYVSEHMVDKIGRLNPQTKEWVEFPLPQAESDVRQIAVDPSNVNRVFYVSAGGTTQGTTGGLSKGTSYIGFVEFLN